MGKVELSEDFAAEVEEYKKSTGTIRVGAITLEGFGSATWNLDDEGEKQWFQEELLWLLLSEEEGPPNDLTLKVSTYTMTKYDFDNLEEFGGW